MAELNTTLALDTATRDLVVNADRNIAIKDGGDSIAQDVASAIKLFEGELWYDTTKGVPYFSQILGMAYAPTIIQGLYNRAALTVVGVVDAKTTITRITDREVHGTVYVIDLVGEEHQVTF